MLCALILSLMNLTLTFPQGHRFASFGAKEGSWIRASWTKMLIHELECIIL